MGFLITIKRTNGDLGSYFYGRINYISLKLYSMLHCVLTTIYWTNFFSENNDRYYNNKNDKKQHII